MSRCAVLVLLLTAGCIPLSYYPPRSRGGEPREAPLSATEVRKMLEAGIQEEIIQEKAGRTGVEKLSAGDLVALKQVGAGEKLLETLIQQERRQPIPQESGSVVPTRIRHSYYYSYSTYPSFYYYSPGPSFYYHSDGCFRHSSKSGSTVRFGW